MSAGVATRAEPPALLLDLAEVCRLLCLSERTVYRLISTGEFPAADVRIGGKIRRWRRETVERWIEEHTEKQTLSA